MESTATRRLHYYATFVAFSTFLLLIAGALVTSNDAGLSVPDWPTSFGSFQITPPTGWVGGVKYEHGHRLVAGAVVLLTIGLVVAVMIMSAAANVMPGVSPPAMLPTCWLPQPFGPKSDTTSPNTKKATASSPDTFPARLLSVPIAPVIALYVVLSM